MKTLYCTTEEMNNGAGDQAAIMVFEADTAVPLLSWPRARGAKHRSVRVACQAGKPGKVLRESLGLALTWCD